MTVPLQQINELWTLACQEAGYVPGQDAVLYLVPGGAEGAAALHLTPGTYACAEPEWPLSRSQIEDANSSAKRDLHRVLVRDFASPRIALGRLAHEFEHAHQYERDPQVYEAIGYALGALGLALEERAPPTKCGSATLYNLLPSEEDANRASARLTTAHFGPPGVTELESTDAPLFRDESPVDAESLGARLLAMMALFPNGVAKVAEREKKTVTDLVSDLGPKAPRAWRLLESHPELPASGRAALERCPTEEEVAAAVRPPLAWAPVVEGIRDGKAAAEQALREELSELRLH
jgi:hypothetical protein